MSTFVLAHLSDPHLAPVPTPSLFELAGKRIGGYVNWRCKRRHFHLRAVLDRLVDDLKSRAPDHITVTGDLVNLSLAAEFAPARAWLDQLGRPQDVTVVPGNHDTYVWSKRRHPQRHWADFMRGDRAGELPEFPFVRRRGPVALIGVTSAVPTLPFRATGRVGVEQLARLSVLLDELARAGAFRIVLIHHPPATRPEWGDRRLTDGDAFLAVLKEHGAELVLHGHEHLDEVRRFAGPRGFVPVIGVPSASAAGSEKYDPAAYNLYAIEGAPGAWRCEMVMRGLSADGSCIVERKRVMLVGG
jgi:3',5'-cyclic AMP phosphodiesterase CpdA